MKTYQDLIEARKSGREADVIAFIQSAIADHQNASAYKMAEKGCKYYGGENPTIMDYEKFIYDLQGKPHKNMFTANHKIASNFFRFAVDQAVSYLLGNGIIFKKSETLKKLGPKFYEKVCHAVTDAQNEGVSFGFWNLDHMEEFDFLEFVPLEDEENGALSAGIRFWQIAEDKPKRVTLYELDGFTEYIERVGEDMEIYSQKRAYILHVTETAADNTKIYNGENYLTFPIVPMKNNPECKSELIGRQNTIDALDLACSNMVNNVHEGNLIYWIFKNCAGLSEQEALKSVERAISSHIVWADGGEDGSSAEPQTIEAPFEGTQTTIDMLSKKLYQDFQVFDSSAVTASNQSATAIKASYVPLDLKVDKLERQVTEFISGILALAGIDDEPTYTRNRIINEQEEMQTLLMGAQYFDDEYITKKALTILGDGDMADEILNRRAAEDLNKFDGGGDETVDGEAPTADEAIDAAEEAVGKTLNGSQTSSLITVIRQLGSGGITEGQAVKILMTSIGVTREEALAIIRGEE